MMHSTAVLRAVQQHPAHLSSRHRAGKEQSTDGTVVEAKVMLVPLLRGALDAIN